MSKKRLSLSVNLSSKHFDMKNELKEVVKLKYIVEQAIEQAYMEYIVSQQEKVTVTSRLNNG